MILCLCFRLACRIGRKAFPEPFGSELSAIEDGRILREFIHDHLGRHLRFEIPSSSIELLFRSPQETDHQGLHVHVQRAFAEILVECRIIQSDFRSFAGHLAPYLIDGLLRQDLRDSGFVEDPDPLERNLLQVRHMLDLRAVP